jgi:hypothetical protein
MTPTQYARQELAAERFPVMSVLAVAGSFYLTDSDWHILTGSKTYSSKLAATSDRSRIIERARKAHDRATCN